MQLVLASTSRYRRDLLQRLGLEFTQAAPQIDERLAGGETPERAVVRLAVAKARAVAGRGHDAAILASDQLAALDGTALGKPGTHEAGAAQLASMSGRRVTYCTAVAVIAPGCEASTYLDLSHVTLRHLCAEEIERYLAAERPFDCAGALKLEGRGMALCENVETADPSALIGLPLIAVSRMLRELGFPVP